jgi:hypothetical protein
MRNDESHIAPNASVQELNLAIHIVATMYFFVVSQNVSDLEAEGF